MKHLKSKSRGTVLDGFAGSGTTIIACDKSGRQARAIEIDGKYVDVAVRRWQEFTGREAVLESSGQSFLEISEERLPVNK
jgi:DNA modification methylase